MWTMLLANSRDDTVTAAVERVVRVYVPTPQTVAAVNRVVRVYTPSPSAKVAVERIIRVYKEKT
ncbi:hypothetical protein KASHIRA_00660 [Serratia phage vB_SmaM-Kashira]|nr:hypothetical protein KASHIRA_00660 [Serratia phage vB_SmaM-Kashira]